MENSKKHCISDYLSKADNYYLKGRYNECVHTLQELREKAVAKELLEICGVDECAFNCIIRNNIFILQGLAFKWDLHDAYGMWSDLLQNFLELHRHVRTLQITYTVPLKCYLNVVHNTLYWGWCHPNGLQSDESHVETCLKVAVNCFKRVLEVCQDPCPTSSFCNSEDIVLYFMERVSKKILQLDGEESLQLLQICIIVVCILIELKPKREIIIEFTNIFTYLLNMRNKLVASVLLAVKNKKKEGVSNFKFGLHEVNSSAGKCDAQTVLEMLKIACCICFIQIEQYAKCVAYLDASENNDVKFQFIHNYLKAYACYNGNETEACFLSLVELEHIPVSTKMKIRYHLLYGSLLAKLGKHFEALTEFFKPLSIGLQDTQEKKDFYPIILYHIAEEYKALHCKYDTYCQSDAETVRVYSKSSSPPTELLRASLQADHLDTLQHLIQVLKDDIDSCVNTNSSFNFQLKILNILHPQPEINLPVALFKLATRLAADGDWNSAGDLFMQLLAQPDLQPLSSLVTQLPHVSVLYHDAAALLLKSNKLQQAETLCRRAIGYYSSRSCSPIDLEHSILCLEDDLVALMLLAKVHKLKGEEVKESEILDRCLGIVHNYKEGNETSVKREETEGVDSCKTNITNLLTALEAKLHLQKAKNYLRRGTSFQNDSFLEFKQAILCNPGDKDVVFSYKLFLDEHQYYERDKSSPLNNCLDFNIENCNSSALRYLLQSQASDDSDVDLFLDTGANL